MPTRLQILANGGNKSHQQPNLCSKNLIRNLASNLQVTEGDSVRDRHKPRAFLISNQTYNVIAAAVSKDIGAANSAYDGFHSRSEEHTSELQSLRHLVCRLLL